ncbi:MAG: hypothetical protein LLG04_12190 [Parachlamydia sp.]|nr:hypothetical protein [Parachlamydia sp.]
MNKNNDLNLLKNFYFEIERLNLPKFSVSNENLDQLVEKIVELDSYYAGLALTVSEGGVFEVKDLYNIKELFDLLQLIHPSSEEDRKILSDCQMFVNVIDQIDQLLRKVSAQKNKREL